MNYKQQMAAASGLIGMGFTVVSLWKSAIYYGKYLFKKLTWFKSSELLVSQSSAVEPGHRAFKFNKISGVGNDIVREGWHFKMPYFERPIIYDVRTHPKQIKSVTGSKGKCISTFIKVTDIYQICKWSTFP